MDSTDREKLEGVALERLLATADDEEQWSFLFRTSGAVDFLYRAMCRKLAPGSDWCWIAWIVPLTIDRQIAGYALFVCSSYGDPYEALILHGRPKPLVSPSNSQSSVTDQAFSTVLKKQSRR